MSYDVLSSFCTPKKVDLIFTKYAGHEVTLPAGHLLVSGQKFSFLPKGGQTVYAYEIDDEDNIIGHYLNGRQVSFKTWKVAIATEEGLRNSNFGQKPLHGMQNLTTRVASRFLEVKKPLNPSTLPEIAEPSVPPVGKMVKEMEHHTGKTEGVRALRFSGHRKARWSEANVNYG